MQADELKKISSLFKNLFNEVYFSSPGTSNSPCVIIKVVTYVNVRVFFFRYFFVKNCKLPNYGLTKRYFNSQIILNSWKRRTNKWANKNRTLCYFSLLSLFHGFCQRKLFPTTLPLTTPERLNSNTFHMHLFNVQLWR